MARLGPAPAPNHRRRRTRMVGLLYALGKFEHNNRTSRGSRIREWNCNPVRLFHQAGFCNRGSRQLRACAPIVSFIHPECQHPPTRFGLHDHHRDSNPLPGAWSVLNRRTTVRPPRNHRAAQTEATGGIRVRLEDSTRSKDEFG